MASLAASLYLDTAGQNQLATLKKANQIPLTRIDKKITDVKTKQPTLNTVKTEVSELKAALQKIRDAKPEEKADAIKGFVKEFNDVQRQLTSTTNKDGSLRSLASVRDARSNLRNPFSDINVLNELKAVGVVTNRDGLTAGLTATATDISEAVLSKIESTVDLVAGRVSSADSQLSTQLDRLNDERSRAKLSVDRADKRTEQSFIKYYQLIKTMNEAMSQGM